MIITLSASELLLSTGVGARRHAANLLQNRPDRHGAPQSWDMHCEGAAGELAAARCLSAYWLASVDHRERHAGDILTREGPAEVRCGSRADSRLILHPDDPDDRRFVLVTGRAPVFDVVGWIVARDGKIPANWQDPTGKGRHAYFVERSALLPMSAWSDPLCARVEANPTVRRLVTVIDRQVEGVERVRITAPD